MYLIIVVILLLLLLQLNVCSDIVLFLILFTVIVMLSKNILVSIFMASIIFIILMELNKKKIYERFEEKEEHDKETQDRVKHLKNIINKLEKGLALNKDDLSETNTIKDYDFDDSKETDEDDDDVLISKKKPIDMTAHEAQKQTYKLIDTVRQLDNTIKTLKPTIDNGNDILKKLESFKLTTKKN
tara:strand:- start:53 stop:607 length:555 start_codon:yes stop_codon:yes gene_type:complete